jgi:ribonucleoside-diphosphate reductase alpha chain
LNLNFPPETAPREINQVILKAHELGIKALYYQRSETILRKELNTLDDKGCLSCEG